MFLKGVDLGCRTALEHLAQIFATMNLLAFAFHTACDCLETLWQQARQAIGTRSQFFQELHTICAYIVFPSWKVSQERPHLDRARQAAQVSVPLNGRGYSSAGAA